MKLPLRIEIFVITLASKGTYRQGFLMPDFENQRSDFEISTFETKGETPANKAKACPKVSASSK